VDDPTLFTIGHSTRSMDDLMALLHRHGIRRLVDVRRYPGSRRHPQFNREAMTLSLEAGGIEYRHAPELGGRRDAANEDSPNQGLRNASFRAYADYMGTPDFQAALDALVAEAADRPVAILCAEAVPWRCHRNLISDAVAARGVEVRHIVGDGEAKRHELHSAARVDHAGRLTYPPQPTEPPEQEELF
jgi:uncharacterized protein (DUF488 family)